MSVKILNVGTLLFTSAIVVGCGGGGGGSESSSKTPSSVSSPSVTLNATSTEVFQGDNITLTWSASNATSCSASGSWTGNISLNGTQNFSTVAPGTNTYTLNCTNGNSTTTAQVVVTIKGYFAEVSNSITVDRPYKPTVASNTTYLDVNGDKKDDLVVHLWSMENFGKAVGNTPCRSQVQIFIFDNGKFTNETTKYLPGSNSLGGCSRKVARGDINNDGKEDLVYAMNQEDGRLTANMFDIFAPMAALVSTGSTYTIRQFGTPSWYHSIGIGYNIKNEIFVNGNGFTSVNNTSSFLFDSAGTHKLSAGAPSVSPTTFQFYNSQGTATWTNYLLQASNSFGNFTTVEGHVQNTNGMWSNLQSLVLAPKVGTVNTISYNGEQGGSQPVFKLNDKHITIAGLVESCQMKLSPDGDNVVLFMLAGAIIPNYYEGMTVEQNNLKDGLSVFKATKVVGNTITEVPLNIRNEKTDKLGNNFDCKDVNGDKYNDIVMYPFSENGLPIIYINDKKGGFDYYDMSKIVAVGNLGWGGAASSIVNDFDKDGIMDLLLYPSNSYSSATPNAWKFYKGQKVLSIN